MFCYQCQEAMGNKGCAAAKGVCGKDAPTSDLQDLLIHTLKGIGAWATEARTLNLSTELTDVADDAVTEGLFASITNANFDQDWFAQATTRGLLLRDKLRDAVNRARGAAGSKGCPACGTDAGVSGEKAVLRSDAATWTAAPQDYLSKAASVGVLSTLNEDVRSLRELLIYGLKGMAAYAHHVSVLGDRKSVV